MTANKNGHSNEDIAKRSAKIKKSLSARRTLARIALVLLVGCIIATLVCALTHQSGQLIIALLFCDMAIPIFFYLLQWVAKLIKGDYEDAG